MKRLYIFSLFLFAHLGIFAQEDPADKLLKEAVENSVCAGLAGSYSVDGTTIWKGSEGYACVDNEIPFSPETQVRTASIAKSMTAIGIMQLYEKGKVDLDAPLQTYLPSLAGTEKADITVRQLLGHTSGIGAYASGKEAETTEQFDDLQAALESFIERPLLFEPGSQFYYSTYGYVVLGRVIEEVSGMDFGSYMKEHIWTPLKMNNTGIETYQREDKWESCIYYKKKKKIKEATENNLSNRIPGGGFYSTLDDLILFGNAIVNNTLVDSTTLKIMTEFQLEEYDGNPYGLGWFLYGPPPHEDLVIGHSGEQTGAATQIMLIPKSKTVVAVVSNTSGAWRDIVQITSNLITISERQ